MSDAGGYGGYSFVAEYYDHVVPYRDRPDVAFYVDAARDSRGPVEAEHLLERCGFHLLHVYADFDKSAFGSRYPGELIMVAEKK